MERFIEMINDAADERRRAFEDYLHFECNKMHNLAQLVYESLNRDDSPRSPTPFAPRLPTPFAPSPPMWREQPSTSGMSRARSPPMTSQVSTNASSPRTLQHPMTSPVSSNTPSPPVWYHQPSGVVRASQTTPDIFETETVSTEQNGQIITLSDDGDVSFRELNDDDGGMYSMEALRRHNEMESSIFEMEDRHQFEAAVRAECNNDMRRRLNAMYADINAAYELQRQQDLVQIRAEVRRDFEALYPIHVMGLTLTCNICTETFVGNRPRIISCGHVFCENCIKRWWDEEPRNSIFGTCPVCRRFYKYHNSILAHFT